VGGLVDGVKHKVFAFLECHTALVDSLGKVAYYREALFKLLSNLGRVVKFVKTQE
jgi:hypothetical protein